MAHNQQPATSNQQPAQAAPTALQAAQAALQAALQGPATINLAALDSGRAYTLRELARAIGYTIPKRANGKPNKGHLRRELARAVQAGKLVMGTQGGYTTVNGNKAGGTAIYVKV